MSTTSQELGEVVGFGFSRATCAFIERLTSDGEICFRGAVTYDELLPRRNVGSEVELETDDALFAGVEIDIEQILAEEEGSGLPRGRRRCDALVRQRGKIGGDFATRLSSSGELAAA